MKLFEIAAVNKISIEEIAFILKHECSDFLSKSQGKFFVRGDDTRNSVLQKQIDFVPTSKIRELPMFYKSKTFTYRVPRDTNDHKHESANKFFKKEFGWEARSQNVLFVYSDKAASLTDIRKQEYGKKKIFLVFPIGRIKYLWSKEIKDFYFDSEASNADYLKDKYTDQGLDVVADINKCEVMINCKEYYLVDIRLRDELKKEL